jgi:hypothetical protein
MFKTIALVAFALVSTSAFAAEIRGGRYDEARQVIQLDVSYGGGCEEHTFRVDLGMCLESLPMQCEARLVERANGDMCEAYIHRTIEIPVSETNLYGTAYLTIKGDRDTSVTLFIR